MSNKTAYNKLAIDKLEKLLLKNNKTYKMDLHIHTNYSADGRQTVEQSILKAKEKHFDIISIADHDSIGAYDEIIEKKLYDISEAPVIIPGIEFTVSFPEYCGRCHVLKYFYDINNQAFQLNLKQNKTAYWNRVGIWFKRIEENKCLEYFFKKYNITCTENNYKKFLMQNTPAIPEYATLMHYLYSLFYKEGIDIWSVFDKTVEVNNKDNCDIRRQKRTKALADFYCKYRNQDINWNYRKLRPILAPLGIDDVDYPTFASSGSLSVNEYGQVQIQKLVNSGINILAHPDASKLTCIDKMIGVLNGLELNFRSSINTNEAVYKKAVNQSLLITKGSDKHTNSNESYEDLSFYEITRKELENVVYFAKKCLR